MSVIVSYCQILTGIDKRAVPEEHKPKQEGHIIEIWILTPCLTLHGCDPGLVISDQLLNLLNLLDI